MKAQTHNKEREMREDTNTHFPLHVSTHSQDIYLLQHIYSPLRLTQQVDHYKGGSYISMLNTHYHFYTHASSMFHD